MSTSKKNVCVWNSILYFSGLISISIACRNNFEKLETIRFIDRLMALKNHSETDGWDRDAFFAALGMDEEAYWKLGGGPGGEGATDDGFGTGWGFGPQTQTDKYGNILYLDELGNVIRFNKHGERIPTNIYGELIVTDRYGYRLFKTKDGRYIRTDEYGNEILTDKFGLPLRGYGSGWPPGWERDVDDPFPFLGGAPPAYAYYPTGISLSTPDFCFQIIDPGFCKLKQKRWGYNRHADICMQFTYSGCGGNENNYLSLYDCEQACKGENQGVNSCEPNGDLNLDDIAVK